MFSYVQKNSRLRFWMIIDFFLSNFRHFSNFLRLLSNVSWEYVWKPVTNNIMRIFPKFRKIMILFPSAIWPSPDQLWIIIKATASPTQFYSPVITYFNQKVSGSLVTGLFCEMEVNCTRTSKDLKYYYFTCGIARLEYFFYYLHKKQLKKLIRNKSLKKKLWKITVFLSKTTFLWNGSFYFNHNQIKTAAKI